MERRKFFLIVLKGIWLHYFVKPFESFEFSFLDRFLLLSFSIYFGVFFGILFKSYVAIVEGSIFIISAGFVAAALSYLAIESSRELREKELERVDLEKMAEYSVDVTTQQRMVFNLGADIFDEIDLYINILEENDEDEGYYLNLMENDEGEDEDYAEEIIKKMEEMEKAYYEKSNNKISKITRKRKVFVDKINAAYDANNKLGILYAKVESNHALDNVDIKSLSNTFDQNLEEFKKARRRVYKCIDRIQDEEIVTKEDILKFRKFISSQRKAFVEEEFPNEMKIFDEVIAMLQAPGLKIYKKSNRYLVVQNICFMIAVFVLMVAFINGFDIK
ncbi:hypothetical protein [Vreelandella titanicae]|uniref:hypothetical protein n=1 Tax=Vreelandella titanicae TaxID=664683 RepID=UPI003D2892D1